MEDDLTGFRRLEEYRQPVYKLCTKRYLYVDTHRELSMLRSQILIMYYRKLLTDVVDSVIL